jgi:hypothetical protein
LYLSSSSCFMATFFFMVLFTLYTCIIWCSQISFLLPRLAVKYVMIKLFFFSPYLYYYLSFTRFVGFIHTCTPRNMNAEPTQKHECEAHAETWMQS